MKRPGTLQRMASSTRVGALMTKQSSPCPPEETSSYRLEVCIGWWHAATYSIVMFGAIVAQFMIIAKACMSMRMLSKYYL